MKEALLMVYDHLIALSKAKDAYNATPYAQFWKSQHHNMAPLTDTNIQQIPIVAKYLREALNFDLYNKAYDSKSLANDRQAIDFVNSFAETYDGIENSEFVLLKVALCSQNISADDTYDFSDVWTDTFANDLQKLLSELNVNQTDQSVYTINALLSGFSIKPVLDNRIRTIQQDVNHYFTEDSHLQLAYGMGLVIPDSVDDQYVTVNNESYSLLKFDLSLIYQNICGLSPIDLYKMPVANNLQTNSQIKKWFEDVYYLNHKSEFSNGATITEADIRNEFNFDNSQVYNLTMESVTRLGLNIPNAVQAFAIDNRKVTSYTIYTLQFDETLLGNQELIQVGSFNPNNISDQYHMPVCEFNKKITIDTPMSAHSQTFANADKKYHEFFIGFYRASNAPKSNVPWAQWIGLFDLDSDTESYNIQSKVPYLYGFNTYRLEAATDVTHDLFIVQTVNENHEMTFTKYSLSDIVKTLHEKYNDNKDKTGTTIFDFGININQFEKHGSFTIPSKSNIISSIQGFAYDFQSDSVIVVSQYGPDSAHLNMDQMLPVPKYKTTRAAYIIPWQKADSQNWTIIPLTNFKNTSIQELINQQTDSSQQPVFYATELESNVLFDNNSNSMYQLIVYHWSDNYKTKQDNLNALVHIFWTN